MYLQDIDRQSVRHVTAFISGATMEYSVDTRTTSTMMTASALRSESREWSHLGNQGDFQLNTVQQSHKYDPIYAYFVS